MTAEPFQYKLFDLYTQSYILTNPQDPESVLIEEVANSLLEKILPPKAKQQLSIATISLGMDAGIIDNKHPEPEKNVLLLAKGEKGIYGSPQYKELLAPCKGMWSRLLGSEV
ncbi:MAG: hypothetical protein AAGE96_23645 [Cyanobacteria bacterium P01_G01_bin.19]